LDIYDHDGKTKICSFNTEDIYQAYNAWYGLWPTMPKPAKQEGGDGNQEKAVMEKARPEQIDKINFNPTGGKTIFQKGKTDVEIFKDNLERVKKFQDKHAAYYLTDDDIPEYRLRAMNNAEERREEHDVQEPAAGG